MSANAGVSKSGFQVVHQPTYSRVNKFRKKLETNQLQIKMKLKNNDMTSNFNDSIDSPTKQMSRL